jgi:hypothetical protein
MRMRVKTAQMNSEFETYWEGIVKGNPTLKVKRIRITTASLKSMAQHAHRKGTRLDTFEACWNGIVAQSRVLQATRVEISTQSVRSIAKFAFGDTKNAMQKVSDELMGIVDELTKAGVRAARTLNAKNPFKAKA